MISPPLDGLYHYKRTVELSIESVRSAPHRVRFAPQNHPLYSTDCIPKFPHKEKGNKKGNMTEKTSQITATYTCYPYFIYFSIFLLLLLPFIEKPVKSMLPLGNNISNNKVTSSILLLKWYLQFQLFRYFHKTIAIRFVGDFLRRTGTHPTSLLAIISKVHCPIAHNPVGHRIVHNIANLF